MIVSDIIYGRTFCVPHDEAVFIDYSAKHTVRERRDLRHHGQPIVDQMKGPHKQPISVGIYVIGFVCEVCDRTIWKHETPLRDDKVGRRV